MPPATEPCLVTRMVFCVALCGWQEEEERESEVADAWESASMVVGERGPPKSLAADMAAVTKETLMVRAYQIWYIHVMAAYNALGMSLL